VVDDSQMAVLRMKKWHASMHMLEYGACIWGTTQRTNDLARKSMHSDNRHGMLASTESQKSIKHAK